jgi:tRNA1Val (adenine37-N6)-methyltransferase
MSTRVVIREGETLDRILGGKLSVVQKRKGCRFSLDALLLAHFIRPRDKEHILDLGTGGGIVPMILAKRWVCGPIVGLDIQHDLIDMARRSAIINHVTDRVEFIQGDLRQAKDLFDAGSFDVVAFNPPYRRLHSGRMNPNIEKAISRHELTATLDDFLGAAVHCLRRKGRVAVIYPAVRAVKLLSRMRILGLEPKRMMPVYSHETSEGQFILVEGLKGAKETLKILPPVFIYDSEREYTASVRRIFCELAAFPSGAAVSSP